MKTTKDRSLKQALAAFSFITVPSIRCCKTRMLLYLESGQVAMMNHCLGQAEANFRAIINNIISGKSWWIFCLVSQKMFLIWDLPSGNDAWLKDYLPSFLSTLLVIPDNPEEGVLFLIKSVLNGINKYSWDKHQGYKPLAILDGVKLLASSCQETYPYTYEVIF